MPDPPWRLHHMPQPEGMLQVGTAGDAGSPVLLLSGTGTGGWAP